MNSECGMGSAKWPKVRLDECAEIVAGATPSTSVDAYWGGEVCWATPKDMSNLEGAYIADTPRKLTRAGLENCAATILPAGSVLFSSRAPIGHVAVNTVPMATNQGFKSFVPKSDCVVAKFLYWWLRTNRAYLESLGNGATFKEVSKTIVSRIEISLPPLAEQRRIAEVLDRVEALRAKRLATLAQLDSLTQSLFLDLFGDPATNPKGWPRKRIGEIGNVITGNTPPRANPDYYGTHIEWIKSDNINTPYYYLTKATEGLSESGKAVARTVPAGSILVTCIAGSPACIGNAAMTDREVAFNQQINAFVPVNGEAHFIYSQMLVGKRLIQEASTAGMKGMVSKGRFEQIMLILPPIKLQREFTRRVTAVETLKTAQRASLAELDTLFATLQHRAFRGEL